MVKFRVPGLRLDDNVYSAPTQTYMLCPARWTDVTAPKDVAYFRSRPDIFEEEGKPRPVPTKEEKKSEVKEATKKHEAATPKSP